MNITPLRRLFKSSTATAGLTLVSYFGLTTIGTQALVLGHYPRQTSTALKMSSSIVESETSTTLLLPFEKSAHNSATIVIPQEEDPIFDQSTFRDRLQDTVFALKELQKTSVWVEVPMSKASLIEEMEALKFEFHHATGKTAKLNLWLKSSQSKVPEFATHHVGVGAVVVNSRNEILCVRELRRNFMPWKVPGGLADLGEHIPEAAQREVLEETRIPTKFKSILSFRHTHGLSNGRSDLYFVCLLDPVEEIDEGGNAVIPEPRAQECEIEDAKWIPLTEYRDMINGKSTETGHPMMAHVMKIYDEGKRVKQKEVKSVVPGRRPNPLYFPQLEEE